MEPDKQSALDMDASVLNIPFLFHCYSILDRRRNFPTIVVSRICIMYSIYDIYLHYWKTLFMLRNENELDFSIF